MTSVNDMTQLIPSVTGLSAEISSRADWQQQLATAYKNPVELGRALQLPESWITRHAPARKLFPMLVPRHFAGLMTAHDLNDPLLRQVWPLEDEFNEVAGYGTDPLGEADASAQPGVLHKYKSRLLVVLRGGCAVNCRYCFRRHFPYNEHKFGRQQLTSLISYLQDHPEINELILSGGDPLMASDTNISALLDAVEGLPQLQRIRVHSRLPVVLPARLTDGLAQRFQRSRLQAILVIHANHPNELSDALGRGLAGWREAGIHLLNQSVLLKGVNDSADTLAQLSEGLFKMNVLPYYLHQLDKVAGASHFAVDDTQATALIKQLQIELPGFLVPKLVREIAGELSKTPV